MKIDSRYEQKIVIIWQLTAVIKKKDGYYCFFSWAGRQTKWELKQNRPDNKKKINTRGGGGQFKKSIWIIDFIKH